MAIVPSIPRGYSIHGGAHLSVDPVLLSGDPGNTIMVSVMVSDVTDLVAYDVELDYDTAALSATNCALGDFLPPPAPPGTEPGTGTVFEGMPRFYASTECNDATGVIRSAVTLLGGATKDVFGPELVMIITFVVDNTVDTPLTINADSQLVALVGGAASLIGYEKSDGSFLAPPQAQLHRWDASVSPSDRQKFLARGETMLTLVGTVRMTNKATRGGYAFVVFDIVDPNDVLVAQIPSNTVFVNPGEIVDVSAPYTFPATQGRYEIFATLWRGPSLDFFVAGESISGLHFFVHF